MTIAANIFIARHERAEAAETYADKLSAEQREYLLENEADFFLELKLDGTTRLLIMEDEG